LVVSAIRNSNPAQCLKKKKHPLTHVSHIPVDSEHWPVYTLSDPQNFVFEQNVSSHPEPDTFRAAGIKYISNLILAKAGTRCESLVACGGSNTGDEIYLEG
jgi:hypothetical protein